MGLDLFSAIGSFDEFWAAYPRKVGKGAARKAYAKAIRIASHDDIMFGLSQQIPAMQSKEKQFVPHPGTWLNQERWSDEPEQPNPVAGRAGSQANAGVDEIAFAATARRTPSKDSF